MTCLGCAACLRKSNFRIRIEASCNMQGENLRKTWHNELSGNYSSNQLLELRLSLRKSFLSDECTSWHDVCI